MISKISLTISMLPALSLGLYAMPALADTVVVSNSNSAYVLNEVVVVADTGLNSADGGEGGSGGEGGTILFSDDENVGGNGGSGGDGGMGGLVHTGNATAVASVTNLVNTNDTLVDDCACDDDDDDEDFILVANGNGALVGNGVGVAALSSGNSSSGGSGGSGGDAGDVIASGDENHSGNGGSGGNGSIGGVVHTGNALAGASITNVVNTNITRILH
ncbi:MAG: hypothetical protein AAB567_00850 [Patescibacteria group bacterium]